MNLSTLQYFMTLLEASDSGQKKLVIVMGGRFQPFHKGHYQCYKSLVKKYGKANVWIATSNKTNFNPKSGEVSPFTFKEKKHIITTLYDVDPRRIIQCKNPAFKPVEIFEMYKKYRPIYVAAVGKKDQERYVGNFFHPLPTDLDLPDQSAELLALDEQAGYYTEVPMKGDGITGTLVREDLLAAADDDKQREKLFEKYFGKYDEDVDALILARLKDVK